MSLSEMDDSDPVAKEKHREFSSDVLAVWQNLLNRPLCRGELFDDLIALNNFLDKVIEDMKAYFEDKDVPLIKKSLKGLDEPFHVEFVSNAFNKYLEERKKTE